MVRTGKMGCCCRESETRAGEREGEENTYIKAPPYLGAPKLARAMSQPVGYLALASGGKVTWREKPWEGERGF